MWALVVITDVALYSLQALLHPGSHDTVRVRQRKDCHLCFIGRNKGSEEAKSAAQSDTTDIWDLNFHLSILCPSGAFPNKSHHAVSHGPREHRSGRKGPQVPRTHLHGACLLIRASLGRHFKAVCYPLLRGPMGGGQLLHEVLQADDPMVGLEGRQFEVLLEGHMDL